jgi:hypothetical protein
MVEKFAEAIVDQTPAILKLPVEDLIKICKHDKLNLEHEYQLVQLINKYLKLRELPEYQNVKVKGLIRF